LWYKSLLEANPSGLDLAIGQIRALAEIISAQEITFTQSLEQLHKQVYLVLHNPAKKLDGKGRPSDVLK
jgi:hypothetical protein